MNLCNQKKPKKPLASSDAGQYLLSVVRRQYAASRIPSIAALKNTIEVPPELNLGLGDISPQIQG
jgi:hypothetical protein